MLSKKLIGSFMLAGPFLAIASLVLFEPGGDEQTFAQTLQRMSENYAIASISMVLFFVAIMIIFIGIHYLARSMQGENKPGSDLAGLASIFALLIAGIAMVSSGLELTVTERESSWVTSGGDVLSAYAISEAIFRGIFVFNGIVMLLLGLAIVKQKNLSPIVGGFFAFFGACVLFGGMFSSGDNWAGMIWFIGFLGFPLMTAATGFLILWSARKSTS
ncbi:MAG: hypothetical protein CL766_03240 [Chloroflexi bacterium]|nr:hypothetical protein [Chloroflexota bacterium]|tara:strand:- start:3725 stop:4375 length:651 start_codon:yes stop_codon:yes gene_type:complete